MASSLTVIGGVNQGHLTGLVTIPSAFDATTNTALQGLLSAVSGAVTSGSASFVNLNVANMSSQSVPGVSTTSGVYEITDTNTSNDTYPGSGSYPGNTVPAGYNTLIVQVPGSTTVTGNGQASTTAIFGSSSNVTFSETSGSGSIYAAGGKDSISLGIGGNVDTTLAYSVFSAGNDTVNVQAGVDTITALGNASTMVLLGNAQGTLVDSGNATVSVVFSPLSSGQLNFVNDSDNAATIYTGAYTVPGGTLYANNAVTAFGGAGGGFFVGGHGGNNSLVGGSGVVTLQGGGNNDVLEANSSIGTNQLLSGPGAETLLASASTGSNGFQINLQYVGIGTITGNDLVSTAGSGQQAFAIGAGLTTITGSNAAGASNVYDVIRDATVGSANITLTDFDASRDSLFISGNNISNNSVSVKSIGDDGFGGSVVTLSDHTQIDLVGVTSASSNTITLSGGGHLIQIT